MAAGGRRTYHLPRGRLPCQSAVSIITIYVFVDCFIGFFYKAYMHMMEVCRTCFSNFLSYIKGYFKVRVTGG